MIGIEQELAALSVIDLIATATVLLSILMSIFAWVTRGKTTSLERENATLLNLSPEQEVAKNQLQIEVLEEKTKSGKEIFQMLKVDLGVVKTSVEMSQNGLYPPTFGYLDSETLRETIRKKRVNQLDMIREGTAVTGVDKFNLFGSFKDGAALVDDYKKIFLRTFNAEFEIIRKQLRNSNLESSEEKLLKVAERLESLGEAFAVRVSPSYLQLKIAELRVWITELKYRQDQKEQRKVQQRLLREQKKEFKKDDEELEAQIEISTAMLNKARKRALELVGMTAEDVAGELNSLEKEIAEHETRIEESMSEAQKTKAGYIYVISNMGSFGEGILKIGMTRRLEPMDRVVELGDASVPYRFDVHTIAFVENAPQTESVLHQKFAEHRVNKENHRKEFFRVSVDDVRQVMDSLGVNSEWYYGVEAREYSESQLIRAASLCAKEQPAEAEYPEAI